MKICFYIVMESKEFVVHMITNVIPMVDVNLFLVIKKTKENLLIESTKIVMIYCQVLSKYLINIQVSFSLQNKEQNEYIYMRDGLDFVYD